MPAHRDMWLKPVFKSLLDLVAPLAVKGLMADKLTTHFSCEDLLQIFTKNLGSKSAVQESCDSA